MAALELSIADEAAMVRFAEDVAAMLRPGDTIGLSGDLGAGKSTFARALIRAIADIDDLEVPSPTFTIVQHYPLRVPIVHCDLYRLADPQELDELGLDEALETAALLIEWPERGADALPASRATIAIEDGPTPQSRHLTVAAPEAFRARLMRSLNARAFLDANGYGMARRRHLQGDASSRAYERIDIGATPPSLLMNAPQQPDGPPIRDGLPYSRIAHLAESVTPFVAIARWLKANGFAAPEIEAADLDAGFLIVENLGGEPFVAAGCGPNEERYQAAIDLLAALHRCRVPSAIPLGSEWPAAHYSLPRYDAGAMMIEAELLIDWYWPRMRGSAPTAQDRDAFTTLWRRAIEPVLKMTDTLVLRDYHSPNLIWRADRTGIDRLGVIDFQDAMVGPAAYDVASLIQDARVTIDRAMGERLLAHYCAMRMHEPGFDEARFRQSFATMAAQRASKILGIFVRLDVRDGKPAYLQHLPRVQRYLGEALAHPALGGLRDWYGRHGLLAEGDSHD